MEPYIILDNKFDKNGDISTHVIESDGDLIVKQYSGINTNTENFIVEKKDGKKLDFAFFKINGLYYININNQHIIDYKKFINIQYITTDDEHLKIKNNSIGEISIPNCDLDIIQKALSIMNNHMKKKNTWYSDILYMIIH